VSVKKIMCYNTSWLNSGYGDGIEKGTQLEHVRSFFVRQ
jgi:hypothetical protein